MKKLLIAFGFIGLAPTIYTILECFGIINEFATISLVCLFGICFFAAVKIIVDYVDGLTNY